MLCGNVWPELGPGRQVGPLKLWDRPAGSGEGGLHQKRLCRGAGRGTDLFYATDVLQIVLLR